MPRPAPVWGFPNHYNPNLMGEVCESCRRDDNWVARPTQLPDMGVWVCRCFSQPKPARNSSEIPD